MASNVATMSPGMRHSVQSDNLLLRETNLRRANDLQLIVSLRGLQSRRAAIPEVRQALIMNAKASLPRLSHVHVHLTVDRRRL